jgi:excinuclease ABC subunit C
MERVAGSGCRALYTVPGHEGDDRLYVLHRGLVRAELPRPRDRGERRATGARADALLRRPPPAAARVGSDGVAEMLLVERWFRRKPDELRRIHSP